MTLVESEDPELSVGIEGDTPSGSTSVEVRWEVRRDAQGQEDCGGHQAGYKGGENGKLENRERSR